MTRDDRSTESSIKANGGGVCFFPLQMRSPNVSEIDEPAPRCLSVQKNPSAVQGFWGIVYYPPAIGKQFDYQKHIAMFLQISDKNRFLILSDANDSGFLETPTSQYFDIFYKGTKREKEQPKYFVSTASS